MNASLPPSICLICCLAFMLTACVTHKQAAPHNNAEHTTSQHSHTPNFNNLEPQFLYLAAQDALKDGQHALAIQMLTALVQQDPTATQPHFQLLELLFESGQPQQVKEHIDALVQQHDLTQRQHEYLELASIRLDAIQHNIDPAFIKLDSFLKRHPANRGARNIQAKLLTSQQRYDEAIAALNDAIQANDLADFHLLQAQIFIKSNNRPAAKTSLLRMQQLAPDNDTPVLMLAALAMKDKNVALSEKLLRSFLHKHSDALRVSQALGQLLIQDKRSVEAILVYREAALLSGNNPAILRPLAMLYFQRQSFTEAENTFRQLLNIKPNDANRFYLAASLEALDRMTEARSIYEQLPPTSVLAADAQLRLAAMDVMNDHIDNAEQRLKNILKNNPKHFDALLMLSTIRINQEQFQLLLDETDHITAISKTPPQLLFNRAVAFESLKQHKQVEIILKRVIHAVPSHTEALNFLAYTYAVQGIKLGKAEALLHRALLLKPDNGYYLDSLAWVYYKDGNYSKAVTIQQQALEHASDDAIMFEHYGDILWRHDDLQAARKAWKKAIKLKASNISELKEKIAHGLTAK